MSSRNRVKNSFQFSSLLFLFLALPAYAQSVTCDGEHKLVKYGMDMPYDKFEYYLVIDGVVSKCEQDKHSIYSERSGSFDCAKNLDLYVKNFPTEEYLLRIAQAQDRLTASKVFSLISAEPFSVLTLASKLDSRGRYLDRRGFDFKSASMGKSIYSDDCRLKYDEYRFNFAGESKEDVAFVFRFLQNVRKVVYLTGVQDGLYVYDVDKKSLYIDDSIQMKGGELERHVGDPWQSGGTYEVLDGTQILYRSSRGLNRVYTFDPSY